MDGAPSVQMPKHFTQDIPFVSRYEDKTLKYLVFCLFWAALCNRKGFLEFYHHFQILQMLQLNFHR
jgi:hypothetical protein